MVILGLGPGLAMWSSDWESYKILACEDLYKRYKLHLVFFVLQVTKIEWRDRLCKQHKCFMFLFERFKQYYLPHIFPQFSFATSLYKPVLGMLYNVCVTGNYRQLYTSDNITCST